MPLGVLTICQSFSRTWLLIINQARYHQSQHSLNIVLSVRIIETKIASRIVKAIFSIVRCAKNRTLKGISLNNFLGGPQSFFMSLIRVYGFPSKILDLASEAVVSTLSSNASQTEGRFNLIEESRLTNSCQQGSFRPDAEENSWCRWSRERLPRSQRDPNI